MIVKQYQYLIILLIAIAQPLADAQDWYAYPYTHGTISATDTDSDMHAYLGGKLESSFMQSKASLRFLSQNNKAALWPGEVWTEFNINYQWFLKFGYFPEQNSIMTVFPLLNVFQSTIFSNVLSWGGKNYPDSTTLLTFGFIHNELSLKLLINPFEAEWNYTDTDDLFFPHHTIPQTQTFGAAEYTLHETSVEQAAWKWFDLKKIPEMALEARWQGYPIDSRLQIFYGTDRATLLQPVIELNTYPFRSYSFLLRPKHGNILQIGGNVAIPLNDVSIYLESAIQLNALNLGSTLKIEDSQLVYPLIHQHVLKISGGGLWMLPRLPIRFLAEIYYNWILYSEETKTLGTLSRAAVAATDISLFNDAIVITPMVLISLKDASQMYSLRASWRLRDEFSFWLAGLQCNGPDNSELGPYRHTIYWRIGLEWSL